MKLDLIEKEEGKKDEEEEEEEEEWREDGRRGGGGGGQSSLENKGYNYINFMKTKTIKETCWA